MLITLQTNEYTICFRIHYITHYHHGNDMEGQTFTLSLEDYTIILNALHYYKKANKRENFQQYTDDRINLLRDRLAYQLIPSKKSNPDDYS